MFTNHHHHDHHYVLLSFSKYIGRFLLCLQILRFGSLALNTQIQINLIIIGMILHFLQFDRRYITNCADNHFWICHNLHPFS